jgi:hypothetical protein
MSEVGIVADDEVGVLALREIGRGVIPLYVWICYIF